MHKKVIYILGCVFLGVGILLGIIGGIVDFAVNSNRRRIMADYIPVTATISEITRNRDWDGNARNSVYIEYEIDGVIMVAPLRFWSSNMFVGQPINIFVSRQNPHDFATTGMFHRIPLLVLLGLMVIFGGIGSGFLIYEKHKKRKFQWLLHYGTPVWANVLGTDENWNIQVNGRPATVLVAMYGNMRFVSGPLDNNDLANIGEHVKVLLDPSNYNKYMFDFKNECYREPLESPAPLTEVN